MNRFILLKDVFSHYLGAGQPDRCRGPVQPADSVQNLPGVKAKGAAGAPGGRRGGECQADIQETSAGG